MTRFLYLVLMLGIAIVLIRAFFGILPDSPFQDVIVELIAFLHSETVSQGLSWLAWVFPIQNFVLWIPAVVNAVLAFYGARMTLLVLRLHV